MHRLARSAIGLGFPLISGCAQIAGIDNTTGPVSGDSVSLQLDRESIGATVSTAPLDLSTLSANFLKPSADDPLVFERVPAIAAEPGLWAAKVPSGEPPVLFTLPDFPDPYLHLFAGLGRHVHATVPVFEHPNPTPPDAGSTLMFDVAFDTPWVASDTLSFYSIGAWSLHTFTGDAPVDTAASVQTALDYTTGATNITGRPLAKMTTQDIPIVARQSGGALVAVLELPPFDQAATQPIAGTMVAVARDQTLEVPVAPATIQGRFDAVRPSVGSFSLSYQVQASPGYQQGLTLGPKLAGTAIATGDAAISTTYGNPFLAAGHDWKSTLTVSATTARTYTAADGLTLPLTASLQEITDAAAPDASMPAPLPIVISINGTTISADNTDVTLDLGKGVPVTFVPDKPNATLYQLVLVEVVPNAENTALQAITRLELTSTEAAFTIPPELLVADHRYVLRAVCVAGGYTAVADGDLTMRSLPRSMGAADSGVFVVKVSP